jgi:hypothetical protein
MIKLSYLAAALFLITPAIAEDDYNIKGFAFLGDSGCPDGPKSDSCILSFQIRGKGAKLLYDGMRAKAVKEECTGGMQKSDGKGVSCIKSSDGNYDCDFAYSFSKKAFTPSAVDC